MWRHYSIRPQYSIHETRRELSRTFYAPTLDNAFAQARAIWPGAVAWECLGSRKDY